MEELASRAWVEGMSNSLEDANAVDINLIESEDLCIVLCDTDESLRSVLFGIQGC